MGRLRNDQDNIIIDLALTDAGRKKLAQGNFQPEKYAFGDDGIDYTRWVQTTGSASQDAEILKSVVIEAPVAEFAGLRYPLISIADSNLQYLPTLSVTPSSGFTLNERDNAKAGGSLELQQTTNNAKRQVPNEIVDGTATILLNKELLAVQGYTPRSVIDNLAYYKVKRTALNSTNGAKFALSIMVTDIDDETWDEMGAGTKPNRTISTVIFVKFDQSGLSKQIDCTINEALSR